MRRPNRTRRLSIAAIVSLSAFGVVLGAGARSFWSWEQLAVGNGTAVGVDGGCLFCAYDNRESAATFSHRSDEPAAEFIADSVTAKWEFIGFSIHSLNSPLDPSGTYKVFILRVPVWYALVLLLIAPVRWLMAQPANAPAFRVITDAKQEK